MKAFLVAIAITLSSLISYCQTDSSTIAVGNAKPKPKLVFSFDSRNSFLLGQAVRFNGVKLGVEIPSSHRFGLGLYSLRNPIRIANVAISDSLRSDVESEYNLVTAYYESILLQKDKWELTVPMHLVLGALDVYRQDSIGNRIQVAELSRPTLGFEVSLAGQYKIIPWLGIGTGLGWRRMATTNKQTQQAFSGAVYFIKLKLFLGELYRSVKYSLQEDKSQQ